MVLYRVVLYRVVLYRVVQKEKLIPWEVTMSTNVRKKIFYELWLILNAYGDTAVWMWRSLFFPFSSLCGLWSCTKSGVYNRTLVTTDELLARISDAAACTKKREDQLRRTTRDIRTRVAKCTEVDGGICEHLLWTVTNLSFLCNKLYV